MSLNLDSGYLGGPIPSEATFWAWDPWLLNASQDVSNPPTISEDAASSCEYLELCFFLYKINYFYVFKFSWRGNIKNNF
jgi:hypothetical protein